MSYTNSTAMHVRQQDHDQLEAQVQAFLANGGKIATLPRGVMVDTATPTRQSLCSMHFNPEKTAERQKAHAEKVERPKKPQGGMPAPGTLSHRIVTILQNHGPQTTTQLYTWFPECSQDQLRGMLNYLRGRKVLTRTSSAKGAPWGAK